MKPEPLTDAELERLSAILARFGDKRGPDIILPSEYLPEIWGDDIVLEDTFAALILRHWNVIADTLHSGEVYLPLLLEDESGISHANDWANGFLRGMHIRKDDWAVLLDDMEHGGWLVPIFALAHEQDPDPGMRPYKEPIGAEKREELIVGIAAGVMGIYRHFETQRLLGKELPLNTATFRRTTPKIGRNDPCPCGSGKKFKQCCGKTTTLH